MCETDEHWQRRRRTVVAPTTSQSCAHTPAQCILIGPLRVHQTETQPASLRAHLKKSSSSVTAMRQARDRCGQGTKQSRKSFDACVEAAGWGWGAACRGSFLLTQMQHIQRDHAPINIASGIRAAAMQTCTWPPEPCAGRALAPNRKITVQCRQLLGQQQSGEGHSAHIRHSCRFSMFGRRDQGVEGDRQLRRCLANARRCERYVLSIRDVPSTTTCRLPSSTVHFASCFCCVWRGPSRSTRAK
jgi:hypothetical protein